ncbi:MAG TPA: penicillin acylase family protein [Candidatus Eisenbacteria bacterium]|nr:penicillin acylase family protein [Candidatus Eisenbacteria bacterium]
MLRRVFVLAAGLATALPLSVLASDVQRWERQARNVTIFRDDWGIAHVYGKSDADAVFGALYAQAEDDFSRVETNYIKAMGRMSEVVGDSTIYQDLRMKLFVDPDTLKVLYRSSPAWLQKLMNAFADGLNFYLYQHPEVKPRLITRFEPWMALSFTEGSIGGDIERVSVAQLAAFYGDSAVESRRIRGDGDESAADGSNGFAIAPALARNGRALLWINPHTSFYFRSELQMVSDEGLNAYGAVTWGQFFVYQGFNRTAGWMHSSSGVDNIDEFLETVVRRDDRYHYRFGSEERPVKVRTVTVAYRTAGGMERKAFTVYDTHRGPVVRKEGANWVSVSLMRKPVDGLVQSFTRTKAADYAAFRRIMELHSNSSNNTVFADSKGNIAYFHANYIPRRDTSFDWTAPVSGSHPATSYKGLLSVEETPHLLNPSNGWLYNCNNWPWSAAGSNSPRREDFPAYVETGREETPRGLHALRLLEGRKDWTMRSLAAAAFDSELPSFERLLPPLFAAWEAAPPADPLKVRLAAPIGALRGWDRRWAAWSIPTTLAIHWADRAGRQVAGVARAANMSTQTYLATRAAPDVLLQTLADAVDTLGVVFGTWQRPWGEINRFQRIESGTEPRFDDAAPSFPVPFTSSAWGSLASFVARPYPGTRKWYGNYGNSFLAVVEFGDRVRAMAVTAGGASGHLGTPHFDDQIERFISGNLREVYFHRSQLEGHTERRYHPGQ